MIPTFPSMRLIGAGLGGLLLLANPLFAQGGGMRVVFDPAVGLARAADANDDAQLTGDEWVRFLGGLGADHEGAVDSGKIKLLVLGLDADGDGVMTALDVELVLTGTDADGNGRPDGGILVMLLPELADSNADGVISEAERAAFIAQAGAQGSAPISQEVLLDWLARSEAIPPADRNAMTAGVTLVTLGSNLDSDSSGRITLDDLNALHRRLDANGDGLIDAREREAGSPGGGAGARFNASTWSVSEAMRNRPPLMPWQRTLEDASAMSERTGKPLLICVNTDGENASESLAWGRYRESEFVELAKGFIPVVASPDTRNPRERDDRGRRIPDARFGRLVNSEHVGIEPLLYERYFDGRRVAPRHVGVSPDGEILFDVFLVQDLSIVDEKLRKFGKFGAVEPKAAEQTEDQLFSSPDAAAREWLEGLFVAADETDRARMAARSLSDLRDTQHPELIRLALRDPSAAVRRQGLWTLLQHAERGPVDQFPVAFAEFGTDEDVRVALVAAARRAHDAALPGQRRDDAAFYARVFSQLHDASPVIERARWDVALKLADPSFAPALPYAELDVIGAAMDEINRQLEDSPDDLQLLGQLVAARARLARVLVEHGGDPRFAFDDILVACDRVLALDPDDGRALGYSAWASYMASDMETAGATAARALPHLVREAGTPLAADVLNVFARARTNEIYTAIGAGEAWPEGAVADALAAYEVLLSHSAATTAQQRAYFDLLGSLTAYGLQAEAIRSALRDDPLSTELHAYLRMQVLRDHGARALEEVYASELFEAARVDSTPALDWFHGLATFLAAEQDVRNRDESAALAAYARSVDLFQRSVDATPAFASSASHYQTLAFAGMARALLAQGRLEDAADAMLTALHTAPGSLGLADGLGNVPRDTAGELRRALVRAGDRERARLLEQQLRSVEPKSPAADETSG